MKKCNFQHAEYLLSTLGEVPPFRNERTNAVMPEIALVGRSNVGKSSLLNHLLHRKKLAKVSAQPGKTQTINYFNIDDQLILVDLPGYGFAKRSEEMQLKWSAAIDLYLETRASLALILLLIDIRRPPSDEDIAIAQWATHRKKPVLIIFTKSDTLKPREAKAQAEKSLNVLKSQEYVLYTIKEPKARDRLATTINSILNGLHQ